MTTGMRAKGAIHRLADGEQVSVAAADAFVTEVTKAINARGRFVVALSGGSTPRGLYRLLTEPHYRRQIDWRRGEFFWGDERNVPPDHEESNYRMARELLLDNVDVGGARIHRMEAERDDLDAAARDYEVELARCFGISMKQPPPRFDVILLGLGEDGHIASLFPRTPALGITDRWVAANPVPQLSTTRITVTYPLINRARAVFFLVSGARKTAAVDDAFCGPSDPVRFPSQGVHPGRGRVDWFIDRAAAGRAGKDLHA